MNTTDARQLLITFVSLIVIIIVFASSVFYNSVEGPLVVACLILLVLVNKDILTFGRDVKIIFFIHLLFALSVLTTGIGFYTRQQVSITEAVSDAFSIIMVSILGLIVYAAFRNQIVMRHRNALIALFAVSILFYCATSSGSRVYGYEGRYVLGIGLLLSLISLRTLCSNRIKSWHELLLLTTLNSVTLAVLFLYIESRALTIALCFAWGIGLFTLSTRALYKLILFLTPTLFCILIQFIAEDSLANLNRYDSLAKLFNITILSTNNLNVPNAQNLDNQVNTNSRKQTFDKPLELTTVDNGPNSGLLDPSRSKIKFNEIDATKKSLSQETDGSLGTRYAMLQLGISEIRNTWLFGKGNSAEAQLIHSVIGNHHPHIHNQYLSYILAGGILHFLLGIAVMFAPFLIIRESFSFRNYISTFPLASFILLMFGTTSFLEIGGWRNLYIIYTYVIVALPCSMQR